ncbi:MAG: hypothetical protein HFI60_02125 [Lachnospiraceae bacterium]|nr:hypothetical protein [Lachnospiraceae bacterium]
MADNMTRYRIEEFQDHQGNVIYPQTDARGVWVDEYALYALLNVSITDEQINAILNGQGGAV